MNISKARKVVHQHAPDFTFAFLFLHCFGKSYGEEVSTCDHFHRELSFLFLKRAFIRKADPAELINTQIQYRSGLMFFFSAEIHTP
jgi:hypothetical protein